MTSYSHFFAHTGFLTDSSINESTQ
uniref:Uncharacterized protein n=1 Tax=Arundo donax TaxID=35708 RepID=A0A0A9FI07_ARUDO